MPVYQTGTVIGEVDKDDGLEIDIGMVEDE